MRIVIIIPTYNEKGSIKELLVHICARIVPTIPHYSFFIVVVDGNSPDGTADAVEEVITHHKNIFLLKEPEKRGIGAAYATGIQYALERLRADAVMEFDGDGQHNPDDIAKLVREFNNGFDLVIGSRYIEGGSVPKEWALWLKFLSRFGSLFTRIVLHLPTRDNTSGLKLTRVKGFAEHLPIEDTAILSRDYAYKIQFLYDIIQRGGRVTEVPIQFRERVLGKSKSTLRDVFDSLRVVLVLRFRKEI
ncbi:MAG: dolichyl-phosphate beta-D-mannosyltransferase [Candidatus Taylorbacteria bacterium CG11_big_fil_rev_8_21_14_0_20_46_11]|uniref:Dolichyl-phosphate beta-D-mannosyltransferase n=1 Tax=Candidatus Taylorbacteria bacterium CG11_big_fil_rev_8_21_14_0_20_46_11 TaxID=1975025 RepID=A0A2H0KCS1_9BACT|nr:MAG: dolichyl-phosphate beta-D-mannosyltransferase [Candidatus Taylorbacteria bacterium CG11_big_fil_rev_8_21_14_0_20_46_11]